MRALRIAVVCAVAVPVIAFAQAKAPPAAPPAKGPPAGMPKPPPPPPIPGLIAEDKTPNGCPDCHKPHPEMNMDATLTVWMAKAAKDGAEPALLEKAQKAAPQGVTLKGKHPDVAAKMKNVPQDCLTCHKATSKLAPPLSRMVHLIHLTGGEKNHFITVYGGYCTNCHVVGDNGMVTLKMPKK